MIVNGRFVDVDERKSASIQADINKLDDLRSDLKSEINNPKDILRDEGSSLDMTKFSLSDFDGTETADRKTRYDYYREMIQMEFIQRGIEIVADDSTQSNNDGDVLKIYSNDEAVKEVLEDLFLNRLDMNNELWTIIYDTAKMGDNFYEIVPDNYENPKKIIYFRYLKPDQVRRIEDNGRLSHYEYDTSNPDRNEATQKALHGRTEKEEKEDEKKVFKLQPWQIVHFKIMNDRDTDPYGASLLKPGVKTYRRLSMLEDIILVYRISRAPERRVFYIDVGNMNYTDAKKFIQKIKNQYRTQNFLDENGNINKKANVLSITSDIFVPRREGGQGTQIDTLTGGQALDQINDLNYFKDKILRTMNIPPAYMGEQADRSRGSLSQQDIKFSRFIERVQAQIIKGLNKVAALELFFNGQKKEDLSNFQLELTAPSNIKELTEIDLISQRMGLIGTVQGLNIYSMEWILKNIMHHSDREIADIKMQKTLEAQAAQGQPGAEGDMGMGAPLPGGEFGAEAPLPGGELPPEGAAPPAPEVPAPAAEAPLAASTIIDLFGKQFIAENKDDFFKIAKAAKQYLKEETTHEEHPLMEAIVDIINKPIKPKKTNYRTDSIKSQFAINEMGGLIFTTNGGKTKKGFKLFEKTKDSEKEVLFG